MMRISLKLEIVLLLSMPASVTKHAAGLVAERLRSGLQIRAPGFESRPGLHAVYLLRFNLLGLRRLKPESVLQSVLHVSTAGVVPNRSWSRPSAAV